MNTIEITRLQKRLNVTDDGIMGRGTFSALFQKAGATIDVAQELAISANVHFPAFGISDLPIRLAHMMAQMIHETGSFKYMQEIASGNAYEMRADLGNIQPGDGPKYKGRGPFQLTGRANYRAMGNRLGLALEMRPGLAAFPSIGLHIACEYWNERKMNALADADDLLAITRKINGGLNGIDARRAALAKMKGLLL